MGIIQDIEKDFIRTDIPAFQPGDALLVRVKIREGEKERVQPFEGVVIKKRGGGGRGVFVCVGGEGSGRGGSPSTRTLSPLPTKTPSPRGGGGGGGRGG